MKKSAMAIDAWTRAKEGRRVDFFCIMSSHGELFGVVIFSYNGDIENFTTYDMRDVKFFKKTYARIPLVIPGTTKEKAVLGGLQEVCNPDFAKDPTRFMLKTAMLVDLILPTQSSAS